MIAIPGARLRDVGARVPADHLHGVRRAKGRPAEVCAKCAGGAIVGRDELENIPCRELHLALAERTDASPRGKSPAPGELEIGVVLGRGDREKPSSILVRWPRKTYVAPGHHVDR